MSSRARFWLFCLAVVVLVPAAAFLATELQLRGFSFFAPRYATAKREVFVKTPSYVQGKNQHLTRLYLDYQRSDDEEHRMAICTMAATEASTINRDLLTPELKRWPCTNPSSPVRRIGS
jgi:hypothetical protein